MNKTTFLNSTRWLVVTLTLALSLASISAYAVEKVTYYHTDALGSPIAGTDAAGNMLWKEDYRPYGERLRKQTESATSSRWYTGHVEDKETGLIYAGARHYDPVLGRFLAIDPVGFKQENIQGFNRYAYAINNPYRYVDPNGRDIDGYERETFGSLTDDQLLTPTGQVVVPIVAVTVGIAILPEYLALSIAVGSAPANDGFGLPARGNIKLPNAKRPVVIGENMKDRVIPEATKRNADYYKPRNTKGDPLEKNRRWIDEKMREKRHIIDIGPDPKRSKRSEFYGIERDRISKKNYPTTR